MKRVKNLIKNNIKLVIGIIIGGVLFGGMGAYAATVAAGSVTYTSNGQSTVNGALNDLYTKANTWVNPSDVYFDLATAQSNTAKTVFASKYGVCINRNNNVYCFRNNNYSVEQNHVKQVFSDVSCSVGSSYVLCNASDFRCEVYSNGSVRCGGNSGSSFCGVTSDGSVSCI